MKIKLRVMEIMIDAVDKIHAKIIFLEE